MIIEYKEEKNKPVIYVFSYDENNKRVNKKITDFEPYFYVLADEKIPNLPQIKRVEECSIRSLFGEKLKKIIVNLPGDVPQIRDKFKKHFEADVVFVERFIIDRIKTIPYENLRVQYLDIETDDSKDVLNTPTPITVIGCRDNFLEKYVIFSWKEGENEREFKNKDLSIYYFDDEKKMLNEYIKFIQQTNPDIITGWYVEEFDLKYLINRMKKLNIKYENLSPIKVVDIRERDVVIKGRIVFDMISGYKYLKDTDIESRRLDDVGRTEVELEKLKFEGTPGKLWRNDYSKLIKYNMRDIEILIKLDEKFKILEFVDELRRLSNCSFKECLWQSMLLDSFLLTQFNNKIIFESRKKKQKKERYKGAIVVEPTKGLHKNILNVDFKSLYPSIIISLNMSIETLSPYGEIEVGNGYKFTNKKEGIIPILEKYLWKQRDEKKELLKKEVDEKIKQNLDRQQYCIKVIMNALYGQTAFPGSRVFCPQIAESITFIGRKILTSTIEKLKEKGHKVIYADTDGVFLQLKDNENVDELIKNINLYYFEFSKQFNINIHSFDLQKDKIYKSLIILTKKKYAGITEEDKFEIKGFETRRSDSSRFARKLQKEILNMILKGVEKEGVKRFLQEAIIQFKNWSYEDIAIPRGMKKENYNSPWLRGVKYSKKYLKINFEKGDKVKLLYIKQMSDKYPPTNELCFFNDYEIPEGTEIDYEKMIDKSVIKKLERIFELIGWDIEEMLGKNKSLMEF